MHARKSFLTINNKPVEYLTYEAIDSTNLEAKRLLKETSIDPIIITSDIQTSGKGRMGKIWDSQSTDNLYMTVAFPTKTKMEDMSLFTLLMGLRICKTINDNYNLNLKVKWPNDLYFQKEKLGGMLTESISENGVISAIIFGFGLNINSAPTLPKATSLKQILGKNIEKSTLIEKLIPCILSTYVSFITKEYVRNFYKDWADLDLLYGNYITISMNNTIYTGIANGITETGSLILKTNDGIKHFNSGTIIMT